MNPRAALILITFIVLLIQERSAIAQSGSVEILGTVYAEDSTETLPFAHILSGKWATTTNASGVFKAPLERDDTIRVSYVGYKDSFITIPSDYEDDELEVSVFMARDTIYLEEAEIFFLPENEEEFKEAIIALELEDFEYDYAIRNINLLKRQLKFANYDKDELDAAENHRYYLSGPQPVYFNFIFDKIRKAMRKGRGKKDLPDLADINPSAFKEDNNKVGISEEEQKQFSDTTSIRPDSTFFYILKDPVKKNR